MPKAYKRLGFEGKISKAGLAIDIEVDGGINHDMLWMRLEPVPM